MNKSGSARLATYGLRLAMPGGSALPRKAAHLADHSFRRRLDELDFYECKNHSESYAWKAKRKHAPASGVCRRWPARP